MSAAGTSSGTGYAAAAANDDEACALGKLSEVGVEISAGRSSSTGRLRRTTSLSAVLSRYVPPTIAIPRLHACRRRRRSEEHTSELQSRQYLVCRLLLEKKKTI